MALIAHWPLNGNTNDISGNGLNGTPTNVTYAAGKIGQAAEFSNTGRVDFPFTIPNRAFSISLWINIKNFGESGYVLNQWTSGSTGRMLIVASSGGSFSFRIGSNSVTNSTVYETNKWYFLTITRNSNNFVRFLIDNELVGTFTNSSLDQVTLQIGGTNRISDRNTQSFINDVRIYDHALTDMEIQEIARAKILHYTFDDMQEPTTNYGRMLENVSLETGLSGSWSISKIDRDTVKVTALIDNPSVATWGNVTTSLTGTRFIVAGNPITLSCEIVNFKGSLSRIFPASGGFGTLLSGGGFGPAGTYLGRKFRTITYTSDWTHNIIIRALDAANILAGDYLTIRLTQIEEKAYPTSYIDSARIGQIKDYSGFNNNSLELTHTNTPRWISDAKIGTGAYQFRSSDSKTYIRPITTLLPTYKDFTVSAWIYFISEPTDTNLGYVITQHYSGGGWILSVRGTDEKLQFRHHRNTSNGFATAYNLLSTFSLQTNTWYHVAAKDDGIVARIYINGIENNNFTISSIIPGPSETGTPIIGAFSTSGHAHFDGTIDDVRIYSTALSDKDIKDLYEARAEIEQSGVLYARDFLSNAEGTENIVFYENAVSNPSYTAYVATTEGSWQANHPNAIRAYNKNGNDITGYVNTGVTDWTNTIHAVWEYDSILDKPVVVMNDAASTSPWMAKSFPITRLGRTLRELGLDYGSKYTLSWLQWADNIAGGSLIGLYGRNLSDQVGFHDGTQSIYNTEAKKWQRVSATFTINAVRDLDTAANLLFYMYGHYSDTVIKIADVQLDLKDHPTPFTDSYRPISSFPSTIQFGANEIHETGTANFEDFSTVGITDGLIGYWSFNGNTLDYSGSNYHGLEYSSGSMPQINSDNIQFSTGKGLKVEGILTKIDRKPFTIIIMTETSSHSGTPRLAMGYSDNVVELNVRSTYSGITVRDSSGWRSANYNISIPLNTPFLFTGTFDGSALKYYHDGIFRSESTGHLNNVAFGSNLLFGNWTSLEQSYQGKIYYAKIFNRVLTAEEIAIEYNTMFKNEVQIHKSGTVYAKDLIQY